MNRKGFEPFLKWAGGKRWFINRSDFVVPNFNGMYFEPFLGGGALFFKMLPSRSFISDMNGDLINAYTVIRDFPGQLVEELAYHHARHGKDYYYSVRSARPGSAVSSAARFIYLNRTCWNGLYRVNLKGEFNVPVGTKKNVIYDGDDFFGMSSALQGATILACDFESALRLAGQDDFLFIDPPYTVKHNNNGFVKYNEGIFSWEDQERLKLAVDGAVERGAKVLITNADHESIHELYAGYERVSVSRASVISGAPKGRGFYSEVIIKSW